MHQTFEHYFDTVVVGGGQADLATGCFLAQHEDRDFMILDARSRVGDVWRSRWASLRAPRYVGENGRLGIQPMGTNPKPNTELGGR